MSSYNAQITPNDDILKLKAPIREHCIAHSSQITTIGRDKGQQVRVERYTPDGETLLDYALYTVIDVHSGQPEEVSVGYKNLIDLDNRLGVSHPLAFTGKINSQVTDDSEFTEHLTDNGCHQGLIVIAPHGGDIEKHTDEQAERVGERLASRCVSVWACKGFKAGGGAFDRWHITSTDISEESFPKLKTVMGRRFEYAIAFHGWDEKSICIGGLAPPALTQEITDLKQQLKTAIESAISGSDIDVFTDSGCPGGFNGDDPKNIVNRLAIIGIQIEQSKAARADFYKEIADAVAGVMCPKIEICTTAIEFVEANQVAPAGKYEIAAQSDKLQINGRNADDTAFENLVVFQREAEGGNMGFRTDSQFGAGQGVIAIANASLAPSVNPAGAGILYVEDGALKYRGPNGTVTTLALA